MITRTSHKAIPNTFRMKVWCRLWVEVTEEADLAALDWAALPQPVMVMGGGSNLLFTQDFPGTVLHVGIGGCHSERSEESVPVTLGAGVVFDDFCAWAASEGLWGPENLSLIPGEVGASAVQNIGAYGVEAKDIIATIRAWDCVEGRFVDIKAEDCAYGYRTSRFKTDWKGRYVITAVTYRLSRTPQPRLDYGGLREALETRLEGTGSEIASASLRPLPLASQAGPSLLQGRGWPWISEPVPSSLTPLMIRETVMEIRRQKLPAVEELGSAGSFFCNPVISREHFDRIVAIAREENGPAYRVPHFEVGDRVKVPAAWMIDQCGFKGRCNGGAQVYSRQPLVIVNASGTAIPDDIIGLENTIIQTIQDKYGVTLHPEVEHI